MHGISDLQIQTASMTGPLGTVILLLVSGMIALGVELFIIPGFGIVGILGIAALLGGMVSAWIEFGATWGVITILATLVGTTVMIVALLRTNILKKRLVLDAHLEPGCGTESKDLTPLLGKKGEALTVLRPAGIAIIEDMRIDVVSDGGFIERGTPVQVAAIDGPRVIVVRVDQ
jgi:membrane-bound serine protease (ClpP class)